jgi:hypothetical protein
LFGTPVFGVAGMLLWFGTAAELAWLIPGSDSNDVMDLRVN